MGLIKLDPQCPKNVNGVSIDPNPNWSFNDLLSELNSLESKLNNYNNDNNNSSLNPKSFTKTSFREFPRVERRVNNEEKGKAFVMRVDDDDEFEEFNVEDGNAGRRSLVPGHRFVCNDVYLSESEDSDIEEMQQRQVTVMDKNGVVEGAFLELTHEHQLGVKEEMRNQLGALETQLVAEKEKSTSALVQVDKNTDARRQMDRKLDLHYQRKIAEALDNHLTAIQRDHLHRSQIEERRIRDDAALEEAKRKEKALQEEKLRQQKAKEEEARLEAAKRAEEERKIKQEAERLAKEASAKEAAKLQTSTNLTLQSVPSTTSAPVVQKEVKLTGNLVRAAENALKLEERRLQTYKEFEQLIISSSHTDLSPLERAIRRPLKTICGSKESVSSKVKDLVKIFNNSAFPQSITAALFAKKAISYFEAPENISSAFACGYLIVYVSVQVPAVMDCLFAEFHKACIYTVPKHISYSKTAFETVETYYKAIGYRESDGKMETTDSYLERLRCIMKLYGAVIQTEAEGVQNLHRLEEGWSWLARFLNALPPNVYTAVALEAFLEMAGFALHRKYRSQFRKIMDTISKEFVQTLQAREDPTVNSTINRLQQYIESKKYLQEPKGWRLEEALLSSARAPQPEQEQYYHTPNRNFTYQR